MEDMSDWMVYLTNNYGLDYGHEYETLDCVMQRSTQTRLWKKLLTFYSK